MRLLVCVILLILVAYGGSLLQRRSQGMAWLNHLFATGFVLCAVGGLIGPMGIGVISRDMLSELKPFIIFSLGWVGFLVGMQGDFALLHQVPSRYLVFTLAESGLTIGVVFAASTVTFWFLGISGNKLFFLALLAGACGGVSAQAIPALATNRAKREDSVFLGVVTGLDDFPVLMIVTILSAYLGPGGHIRGFGPGLYWVAISILLGLGFGLAFYLLLRPPAKFQDTLAICIGATILTAGAAAYLHLAVPGIGFLAGFFVANAPLAKKETFYNVLTVIERPIVFLMFLLAGANLRLETGWWFVPVAVYVFFRGLSKVWGGRFLTALFGRKLGVTQSIGWGLVAPGPLSVAVALDYACLQGGPHAAMVLWMVTAGAVLGELIVPLALRRLEIES